VIAGPRAGGSNERPVGRRDHDQEDAAADIAASCKRCFEGPASAPPRAGTATSELHATQPIGSTQLAQAHR